MPPTRQKPERLSGDGSVTLFGRQFPFRYGARSKDLVRRIFAGETYPIVPFIAPVGVVFDVGASVGAASIYFHAAYPEAAIWAFEPHAKSYSLLAENVGAIDNIRPVNLGLSDAAGWAPLYIGHIDDVTNSIGRSVLNTGASEPARLEDAATFAKAQGITALDILKVDTEGCEVPIIASLLGAYRPRAIYLEYHSEEDRLRLDAMLRGDFILYRGTAANPHRGELCYVRKSVLPAAADGARIVLPA